MKTEAVKKAIKEIVLRHEPDAEVILYGSRARGDAEPDSDWDILVLMPENPSPSTKEPISDAIYDLEFDICEVLSLAFNSQTSWDSDLIKATPFHKNVTREGIRL